MGEMDSYISMETASRIHSYYYSGDEVAYL
jgi:hypothetical protein